MQRVVFLASHRLSPPPTPSPLLNWVSPCKCGGYKAEPSFLMHGSQLRKRLSPTEYKLCANLKRWVTLPIHMDIVKHDHHHTSCSGQPTPCREGEMYQETSKTSVKAFAPQKCNKNCSASRMTSGLLEGADDYTCKNMSMQKVCQKSQDYN